VTDTAKALYDTSHNAYSPGAGEPIPHKEEHGDGITEPIYTHGAHSRTL
jgi:hypothetical protein